MLVSLYRNFHTPVEEQNITAVFETIQSNKFENEINAIRLAYHKENKKLGDTLKSKLLAFTPSGTFSNGRKVELLKEYNQVIHLDFDKLEYKDLQQIKDKLTANTYTFACFLSPSGKGFKVFVQVNSDSKQHTDTWLKLREYYFELLGIESDPSCKDISRLCFFSYDKDLYFNVNSEVFKVELLPSEIGKQEEAEEILVKQLTSIQNKSANIPSLLEQCLEFTDFKSQFIEGNRNNYIFQFSCNANRLGIHEDETLHYLLNEFDFDKSQIKASVKSAYKNNSADFAKSAKFAKSANFAELSKQEINLKQAKTVQNETQEIESDLLFNTPCISHKVYDNLPHLLKNGVFAFFEQREKDVFFTSALSILSGCLPNTFGVYGQRTVYPNLFTFILSPAASGKGAMISAKELADKYHDSMKMESMDAKKEYDRQMREYKKRNSALNKKADIDEEPPEEPKFRVVFIPANTSSAKIYQHLQDNDEQGIICETEADTLGLVFKNEWGSYSDLLRKGFHHEKVSLSRKTNNEYLEINNPRLSVALSGTPNQIFNIISNAEDGLFSRFLYYIFRTDSKWISPAPKQGQVNLTEHFKTLSSTVFDMVEFLSSTKTEVFLTQNQWDKLDHLFTAHLQDIESLVGLDALSVVKRMGLILYRICIIFTAIRKFENGDISETLFCSDDDFESAVILTEIYLEHSVLMFNNLPNQSAEHALKNKTKKEKFFDELPPNFQRKEAVVIGQKFGIKERTVDDLLKKWTGALLEKEDTGFYGKM